MIIARHLSNHALVIRKQTHSLVRHFSPNNWAKGTVGDVILLPGFGETWFFMEKIGNHLNSLGFKVHVIRSLARNTAPVEKLSDIIEHYLVENNLNGVTLVAHSKGGLVARYLLALSPAKDRINRTITIASPHHGTRRANLKVLNLHQLVPDSLLLRELYKYHEINSKIVNIYPEHDATVVPNESLLLHGSKNIKLNVIGHSKILESAELLKEIEQVLKR